MSEIVKLKTPISPDQLEAYLRFDFPKKKVKRNLFGNTLIRYNAEINVIFKIKKHEIVIYPSSHFFARLLSSGNIYAEGLLEDGKLQAERIFYKWLKERCKENFS